MSDKTVLGFIGGSGIYAVDEMDDVELKQVETPWGKPSGPVVTGTLAGVRVLFLPRHGPGHAIPPSEVNYRANIAALKILGATDVISVSACGSFREELSPGTFVIVDQFIDRTHARAKSFFGTGLVAHVSIARPVCPKLADALEAGCRELEIPVVRGGTYLAMEGPQFSSKAESHLYRSWGCDVIGMTNMPEAKLAREAELPYASVAMVTDYDCWRDDIADVEVTNVLEILQQNSQKGRALIKSVAPKLGPDRTPSPLGIETCLDFALITPPDARDPAMVEKLKAIAGRVLG
ncbi:S-methyl-5'-thioadenosine phosphorylase [Aquisalinus flavus]|uniref:S-methyl-5'-thioadenosine phosphorylase n=1 Tax=Aquisalinus flavus TaxID=1526572 RepID=A0A8J2V133_9PROT|nr:S-methyl-5'-thioadenosine phosphorylase [Aquisalinus flavus]MBD0427200.1 S-methyl-5'-thioadenosine phosphorylase [Aquisalinus flavus]UNE47015.1 S-methyl-5'-thioadenosine phosphorylase [Aquisalinus flavus]GGC99123.1 S-methyl-5'-thioadenosine phosphorylase [Aquisalinus flavus]